MKCCQLPTRLNRWYNWITWQRENLNHTLFGISVFGISIGVTFGTNLGNMTSLGIGVPIGMVIGMAIVTGILKKAFKGRDAT